MQVLVVDGGGHGLAARLCRHRPGWLGGGFLNRGERDGIVAGNGQRDLLADANPVPAPQLVQRNQRRRRVGAAATEPGALLDPTIEQQLGRSGEGVTLGALSFPKDEHGRPVKGIKRHPEVRDNVTIYAEATILGGDTVIGARSVIGGNVWITESVPPDTRVLLDNPRLIFK